jgi:hypothetical protein
MYRFASLAKTNRKEETTGELWGRRILAIDDGKQL